MAVLAPPDWYPPRDPTMDVPSNSSSIPRQRSSPTNGHSPSPTLSSHPPQQQTYSYPVQQQQPQGSWTPSIAAQPFYPSFYQNHHPQQQPQQQQQQQQQPYPHHGHSGHSSQGQIPQQTPYFDPANAQLAQWAYQQMMFNAQQGFTPHIAPHLVGQQRGVGGANTPNDYFSPPSVFNPFPSGTPPPNQFNGGHRGGAGDHQNPQSQYNGFHPYRRPIRQSSQSPDNSDWRPPGPLPPQFPYGHRDASGSSSSVNSGSSLTNHVGGSRPRTNSNQSGTSAKNASSHTPHSSNAASSGSVRSRSGSLQISTLTSSNGVHGRVGINTPPASPSTSTQTQSASRIPHNRNPSSSSSGSSSTASPRPSAVSVSATSSTSLSVPAARPARPSPLSQGNFTAAEKRMSRDDSDLAAMRDPIPSASMIRSGGLKGRLRRALSFNAAQTLREEDDDSSIKASSSRALDLKSSDKPSLVLPSSGQAAASIASPNGSEVVTDGESTATVQVKKKSRAASLFNSRLNASTDNISLSSTVSSASVMIRKLGSMGKLARRNSLAGITSLFKDKKDKEKNDDDADSGKKGKKKAGKSGKGEASEASVSHVTAELDRASSGDWTAGAELSGLSPAAKLARQHTLKSNAEAAARAKAAQEASASATVRANGTPATWEKNTTTRQGSPIKGGGGVARVNEDGTRVFVEDDDSPSEDGSDDGHYGAGNAIHDQGWGEDEEWGGEGEGEEDLTIRAGLERASIDREGYGEEDEVWAVGARRSVEKARKPAKGILKYAGSYDQLRYLAEQASPSRVRSNSYNSHPGQTNELGPLARIPSPDPDHIDGLHKHPSYSSSHSAVAATPTIPPFMFESSPGTESPKEYSSTESLAPHPPEKSLFNHPNLNSSAPALSTMLAAGGPPTLTHRSATAPAKRLAFASNLSVYDTFSSTVYDRRSEPATWSRLTPALAQRIKEELNSYKMEEMEVHAASRIHTQFFV